MRESAPIASCARPDAQPSRARSAPRWSRPSLSRSSACAHWTELHIALCDREAREHESSARAHDQPLALRGDDVAPA
jgi:hypothetical protein